MTYKKGGTLFMAKKGENRAPITLACSICGHLSRPTEKNKKNATEKLTLNKYCPVCRKTTEHKEKKN